MAQKLPKLFKPLYTDKDFQKKILKKVFLPSARTLALSLYCQQEDTTWALKPEFQARELKLDKKLFKEIGTLSKEISKNSGIFDFGKLGIVGVLAVGIIVFVTFFLDGIVRDFTISSLQNVFGARVDVGGLFVRPWEGKVYFADLAIADRENPTKNLVTMKDAQVDIDVGAIFGGSFLLNRLVAREMAFGTDRTTSGALLPPEGAVMASVVPADQATQPVATEDLFEVPLAELPFGNLLNLTRQSPKDLFQAEVANLKAVALIETATATFQERADFWRTSGNESQLQVRSFGTNVTEISRRDVRQIRTLLELQAFLQQVKTASSQARTLLETVRASADQVGVDAQRVKTLQAEISDAVAADWKKISGLVRLPEGGPVTWVGALLLPEVNRRYGSQIALARRVWNLSRAVLASSEKKEVQPRPERRGQDMPFPGVVRPRFLLGRLEVSFGSRENRDLFEFLLTDVSSQPDLTGKPFTLAFTRLDQEQDLNITALADLRTDAAEPFSASALISNEPFAIAGPLAAVGINSFEGVATWNADVGFPREGGLRLQVAAFIDRAKLAWKESGEVTDLVDRILTSARTIELKVDFLDRGGERELSVRTNLDEAARREIERWALGKIRDFEVALRRELDAHLASALGGNRTALAAFNGASSLINLNAQQALGFQRQLEDKKREVEHRIANFAQESIQQALPNVRLPF